MATRMVAPARFSASRMGRPVSLIDTVPGKERKNVKHRIFWSNSSHKTADMYNSVVTLYCKPDMRRWLEFKGGRVPKNMRYLSLFPPSPVQANPERFWTVFKDGEPLVSYTNCIEAWLIVLSGEAFNTGHKWAMVYTDRTGKLPALSRFYNE